AGARIYPSDKTLAGANHAIQKITYKIGNKGCQCTQQQGLCDSLPPVGLGYIGFQKSNDNNRHTSKDTCPEKQVPVEFTDIVPHIEHERDKPDGDKRQEGDQSDLKSGLCFGDHVQLVSHHFFHPPFLILRDYIRDLLKQFSRKTFAPIDFLDLCPFNVRHVLYLPVLCLSVFIVVVFFGFCGKAGADGQGKTVCKQDGKSQYNDE